MTPAVRSPAAKANIALASVERPWGGLSGELWAEIYQQELKWSRSKARHGMNEPSSNCER